MTGSVSAGPGKRGLVAGGSNLAAKDVFQAITAEKDKVSFLQIGGNDGKMADPINQFLKTGKWTGHIYEPLPHYFAQLQKTYRDVGETVTCINAAVSDKDGEGVIYAVDPSKVPAGKKWMHGLASFDRSQLTKIGLPDDDILATRIDVVSMATATARLKNRDIDVWVMDVEGHEATIFDAWDPDTLRPRIILFEAKHFGPEERRRLRTLLDRSGYEVFDGRPDAIAVHRSQDTGTERDCLRRHADAGNLRHPDEGL